MKQEKRKSSWILGIIILLVSLFLTVGVKLVFPACGQHEENGVLSYASCYWAEQAVFAAGGILTILAILMVAFRERTVQVALSIGIGCGAILTALIPQILIRLCVMPSMRCLSTMRPAVIVTCSCLAILCVVQLFVNKVPITNARACK